MKRLIAAIMAVVAMGAVASERFAYKGRLAKPDGSAFNTSIPMTMTFRLYGAATGGQALWGRTMPVKMKADGSFSVELVDGEGSATADAQYAALGDALAAARDGVWIGLTPQSYSEMAPRQRLNPVPRALKAETARSADVVAAQKVVADTLTVSQESSVGTLAVAAGGTIRQTASGASLTMEARGERTLAAGGNVNVTGAIYGITDVKDPYHSVSGTAPNDRIILWRYPEGITGEGWTALVVPKGATQVDCNGQYTITTAIGR